MKVLRMMPIGAALFALGLGSSVAPSLASARDEDSGTRSERKLVRLTEEDRDQGRDSESGSGYLGVQVQRLTAALRRAKGIPESTEGTLVNNVEDRSPADDGGVKRGDVIVEVNHQPTPNPSDLVQTVQGLEPGKKVSVRIWRDGATRTLTLTVGPRPEGTDMRMRPPAPPQMPNWDGPGDSRDMPDMGRMQIMRRNRDDIERQVRDLQDQISSLRQEVQQLRMDLKMQMGREHRNRDNDHNRNEDRDRDNSGDD